VHPRVGALDVLPFVPLAGLTVEDAVASARRVAASLVELGLPVYFYGEAAARPRTLAELRRGGFEALADGYPPGREPDLAPAGRSGPHPTAGATLVGVRRLLLAWNVYVEGVSLADVRHVAAELRERSGGFPGLRALAFELASRGERQISMNLEDLDRVSPFDVFRAIEERVAALGGAVSGTEVVGMVPDGLVLRAAEDRLRLLGSNASRMLSARVAEHVCARLTRDVRALVDAVEDAGQAIPPSVRDAAARLSGSVT
jgi:glutamate formiminotransferase